MVKIYKTQNEVEADIKDNVLVIQGDVKFECSISINASIKVVSGDINARNINAGDIVYYAFCSVYNSINCLSIKAKRKVHSEPVCLDGKLEIKKPEEDKNTEKKQKLIDKVNELKEKVDELFEKASEL